MAKSHLIVIFDCSGSMSQPFQATEKEIRGADYIGPSEIKISEAKAQLISRLKKSDFEFVTIIPFNTHTLPSFSREIPKYINEVENFIRNIQASGNTNLAEALLISIQTGNDAEAAETFSYLRHLIITDGLSHTPEDDIKIVETLSKNQGIDILLIDPTEEGESHLRKLCKRGHLFTVASAFQLRRTLEIQDHQYSNRIHFNESLQKISRRGLNLTKELGLLGEQIYKYKRHDEGIVGMLFKAFDKARTLLEDTNTKTNQIKEYIMNHDFPKERIENDLEDYNELIDNVEKLVESTKKFIHDKNFKISLFHPKLLSKKYSSPIIVKIYPKHKREEVAERFKSELENWIGIITENIYDTKLKAGMAVVIKIKSIDIEFSEEIIKYIENEINTIKFIGKPKDTCHPGVHTAILTITDEKTKYEIQSISFKLRVVDFVFDHISRPILSKIGSALLGIRSLITFILTIIGKIDQTLGISLGAIVGTFAMGIFSRFFGSFRIPHQSSSGAD